MKILHVVENLNRGGLERVVLNLVEHQINSGNECVIICLFEEGLLSSQARQLGVDVIALNKESGIDFGVIKRFRKELLQFRPDIIHSHNPIPNYYAAISNLFLNIPLINTRHGMGANPYSWKRELLYRLSLLGTEMSVAVCNAALNSFLKRKIFRIDRSIVITNGIKIEKFNKNNNNRKQFTKKYNLDNNTIIFGAVGRLNHAKDYHSMIKAFEIINKVIVNSYLVIIGGGDLEKALRDNISQLNLNNILMLGDQDDVPYYLSIFDIFLMSSITEGYSMALLEAGASGLPCIVTDVGGNSEIIQNNKTGYIVPPRNPALIAEKSIELLESGKLVEYGNSAKAWVYTNGSIEVMANKYMKCYEEITKS